MHCHAVEGADLFQSNFNNPSECRFKVDGREGTASG